MICEPMAPVRRASAWYRERQPHHVGVHPPADIGDSARAQHREEPVAQLRGHRLDEPRRDQHKREASEQADPARADDVVDHDPRHNRRNEARGAIEHDENQPERERPPARTDEPPEVWQHRPQTTRIPLPHAHACLEDS